MNAATVLTSDCEAAQAEVVSALQARGLSVVRSFDLRSALTSTAGCTCPYHGTTECCCQYVILLVYGQAAQCEAGATALRASWPATLTLHSRGEITRLELVQDANAQTEPALVAAILTALAEISEPTADEPAKAEPPLIADAVDTPYPG